MAIVQIPLNDSPDNNAVAMQIWSYPQICGLLRSSRFCWCWWSRPVSKHGAWQRVTAMMSLRTNAQSSVDQPSVVPCISRILRFLSFLAMWSMAAKSAWLASEEANRIFNAEMRIAMLTKKVCTQAWLYLKVSFCSQVFELAQSCFLMHLSQPPSMPRPRGHSKQNCVRFWK